MVQAAVTKTSVSSDHPSNYRAMVVVTSLFFMWGLLTCLNDILIPHLKAIFDLSYFQVILVQNRLLLRLFHFFSPSPPGG